MEKNTLASYHNNGQNVVFPQRANQFINFIREVPHRLMYQPSLISNPQPSLNSNNAVSSDKVKTKKPTALKKCAKKPTALKKCAKKPTALKKCAKKTTALKKCAKIKNKVSRSANKSSKPPLYNAQHYAFDLYSQLKNKNTIYTQVSKDSQETFGLSAVEIVFFNYFTWYHREIKKEIVEIQNNASWIREYVIKCGIKGLGLGCDVTYYKWKKYVLREFKITFPIEWDSFRVDHKMFILYPDLRNYASQDGIIKWVHVRKWPFIEPFVQKNLEIHTKSYFDSILKDVNNRKKSE